MSKEGSCTCRFIDPVELEKKLKPYEDKITTFRDMLFWKKPIAMGLLLFSVNLVFVIVGIFNLSFVPTVFLLLTVDVLRKIITKNFGKNLEFITKTVNLEWTKGYAEYPFEKICEMANGLIRKVQPKCPFCPFIFGKEELTNKNVIPPLVTLVILFIFFLIIGTYWFNVIVINMLLILPGIVLHPVVKAKIQNVLSSKKKNE